MGTVAGRRGRFAFHLVSFYAVETPYAERMEKKMKNLKK